MLHDGPERLRRQAANLCHSGDPLQLLLRRGRIEHNLLPRDIPGPLATELHRFFAGQDAVEEAGMDGTGKAFGSGSRVYLWFAVPAAVEVEEKLICDSPVATGIGGCGVCAFP
jgi:hypothetical protein